MAQTLWPIEWPKNIELDGYTPEQLDIAERFAAAAMYHLSGRRYGRNKITVMPCANTCKHPRMDFGDPWHPVLLESGRVGNCFCHGGCSCDSAPSVLLDSPVGGIVEVIIDGVALPKTAYRVENGYKLVRLDGKGWPACSGDRFTVTYYNGYAPGKLGEIAAGYLAAEYLKLFNPTDRRETCRLPSGVTSIARAGVNIEIQGGMFPDGVTGIKEVDSFLVMVNPNAIKVPPTIHSLDRPRRQRQVTWKGF